MFLGVVCRGGRSLPREATATWCHCTNHNRIEWALKSTNVLVTETITKILPVVHHFKFIIRDFHAFHVPWIIKRVMQLFCIWFAWVAVGNFDSTSIICRDIQAHSHSSPLKNILNSHCQTNTPKMGQLTQSTSKHAN